MQRDPHSSPEAMHRGEVEAVLRRHLASLPAADEIDALCRNLPSHLHALRLLCALPLDEVDAATPPMEEPPMGEPQP